MHIEPALLLQCFRYLQFRDAFRAPMPRLADSLIQWPVRETERLGYCIKLRARHRRVGLAETIDPSRRLRDVHVARVQRHLTARLPIARGRRAEKTNLERIRIRGR